MYKILGSDGKVYGPISAAQLRAWLQEGRVGGTTQVQSVHTALWSTVHALPEFAADLAAPPLIAPRTPSSTAAADAGSGLNVVIPYRNGMALTAYYLGVFSLIPFFGILLGIAAVILGVLGWRKYRQNPALGGPVHAWIGIVLGALCALGYSGLLVLMIGVLRH